MSHMYSKETGVSCQEVGALVEKSAVPAILLRIFIFAAIAVSLAGTVYCSVMEKDLYKEWKWFEVAMIVVAVLDTIAGDYYTKWYGARPGSIPYGFFLLASVASAFCLVFGIELFGLALSLVALMLALALTLQGFNLFE